MNSKDLIIALTTSQLTPLQEVLKVMKWKNRNLLSIAQKEEDRNIEVEAEAEVGAS